MVLVIILQTCLCHDKVFEVDVFRLCFGIFKYFCSCKNDALKTIVDLTEIWDAFLTTRFLKYLLKLTGNT